MRLALKPGLVTFWRDQDTLQIGVDPRRGVTITGGRQAAGLIALLDGSRDGPALTAAARALGITDEATDRLITLLAAAGLLDDFPAAALRAVPDGVRDRLAPELATTSLAHGDGDGGARSLARRSAVYVRVHGAGKVGACVATLLASSGVGHVTCHDTGQARAADVTPAGLAAADVGEPRPAAAARAVRRAAPQACTDDQAGRRSDMAVLTSDHGPELTADHGPELAAELTADGVPHLAVAAGEAIGVVGPLVQPGRSACLRCLDLHRADRDPAWPAVLAQLIGRRPATPACGSVLAASVAAQACAQLLAFIDRGGQTGQAGPAVNGTLELVLPDWQWRRRTWPPHPRCRCGAARTTPR
jgi:hypothetical protein